MSRMFFLSFLDALLALILFLPENLVPLLVVWYYNLRDEVSSFFSPSF